MEKRDFKTYQKRFRDFEILPKFSETHVFRGTIRHPFMCLLLKPAWVPPILVTSALQADQCMYFKKTNWKQKVK